MTYCAGWKYENSVYLLGDTAVTKLSPPSTERTSFGQLHDHVRGEYVEEALLKIVPIAPGTAVAFAGNVELAGAVIDFLKEQLPHSLNLESLFDSLSANLGPFVSHRHVELLLASSPDNAETSLMHWDSIYGLDTQKSDYYQIGSLTSYHAALTPQVLSILVNGKLASDRILPMLTAVVQSYGIHNNIIDMNVGGLIFGLRVSAGESIWQEDTNFVLYDPLLSNIAYVSAFARDNVLVVNSSLTNDVRVFAHSASLPACRDWLQLWEPFVKNHINSDQYRYWVFISTIGRVITILRREMLDQKCQYFSLEYFGEGRFSFGMSPELRTILTKPLVDLGDGSIPFRLNFRNA